MQLEPFKLSVFSLCKQGKLSDILWNTLQASRLEVTFVDCWALLCFLLPLWQHFHFLAVVSKCTNELKCCEISPLFVCIAVLIKVRLLTYNTTGLKLENCTKDLFYEPNPSIQVFSTLFKCVEQYFGHLLASRNFLNSDFTFSKFIIDIIYRYSILNRIFIIDGSSKLIKIADTLPTLYEPPVLRNLALTYRENILFIKTYYFSQCCDISHIGLAQWKLASIKNLNASKP